VAQELEFLADAAIITPQQFSAVLSQMPDPDRTQLHVPTTRAVAEVPVAVPVPVAAPVQSPVHSPIHSPEPTPVFNPPTAQFQNTSLNEKATIQPQYPSPAPPPAYAQTAPVLSLSSAMYAYTPTDAGDLALQPNDRIQVLEHMNNDCKSFVW
jgi:LAS seventeen-binding protein 1/2